MDADERCSAAILFAGELADGGVEPDALGLRPVRRAVTVRQPARIRCGLARVALKVGALSYERNVSRRQHAARASVLGAAAAGPPRILVRVDEFPHFRVVDEPHRYGSDSFERFHEVLASAGVPYLLAVLPAPAARPLDPDADGGRRLAAAEAAVLRRLLREGTTLALHGYDHRTRNRGRRRRSELSGLSERELEARLDAAEAVFAAYGLGRPRVFVPPFNHFRAAQWPVLAARYTIICGGPESVSEVGFLPPAVWREGAVWLPSYPPLYGTAAEVLQALEMPGIAERALWVPVVLHWGWESDRGLDDLRRLAKRLARWAVPWDAFLDVVEARR